MKLISWSKSDPKLVHLVPENIIFGTKIVFRMKSLFLYLIIIDSI